MNKTFLFELDLARDRAGSPFKINSGYRCPAHNKKIGGVDNSAHTKGEAADIEVENSADRFNKLHIKVINTTDDGSFGEKGTAVDIAQKIMSQDKFDFVYASGPEMMMKVLQNVIGKIDYEFLFERYMKCAIGICGNCTMDPLGLRLCVEGPVLPKKKIELLTEFGKYHRDASGKRHEF